MFKKRWSLIVWFFLDFPTKTETVKKRKRRQRYGNFLSRFHPYLAFFYAFEVLSSGVELQGGPCGPRTTLRSAQPRPIGRVSTRPVARDLTDSAICNSRIVLFPYFAWRAVQSWGRSTAATQLLAAASTAIAHRTPTTDIVISTSANAKQQPSRSRHS